MGKKELFRILDTKLNSIGFQRKSTTWYLDQEKIINVIDLQRSSYSNLFYVNICIYLKELSGERNYPVEEQCHIRTRLSNEIVDSKKKYDYLFDLDNVNLDSIEYEKQLYECVDNNMLPQLELIKSKEGLLKIAEKNAVILNMLPLKVKSFLGIKTIG